MDSPKVEQAFSNFRNGMEATDDRLTRPHAIGYGYSQGARRVAHSDPSAASTGNNSGETIGRTACSSQFRSPLPPWRLALSASLCCRCRASVAAQSAGLFVNAVDLDIVPAEREKFLAAITENGAASVTEPGCRRFDILNLASDPNHFFLYEIYDNEAALKSHRETAHFKKYAATVSNMVAKRDARPMSVVASNTQAK